MSVEFLKNYDKWNTFTTNVYSINSQQLSALSVQKTLFLVRKKTSPLCLYLVAKLW